MRIVVCIKHVPDVQSERRIEDGRLVRGEEDVLNELDENAVEAAVCLAEEADGEVIALTMGPEDAEDGVRRALQMGADSGVVVADDGLAGADVVTTARVLAAALHRPALTLANHLEVDGGAVTVTRAVGTVREVLSAPLPALVSVTDQANEPRYPNFAAMRAAKKKPIDFWDASELGLQLAEPAVAVVDDEARPAREAGIIRTDAGEAGRELAAWLVENKLV